MEIQTEGQTQDPGPGPEAGETEGDHSEATTEDTRSSWREEMDAKFDLLQDSVSSINRTLSNLSRPAPAATAAEDDDDYDDEEPLTGSKVSKIVNKAIGKAVNQTNQVNSRTHWDEKAKSDFPLTDPVFVKEFRKTFNELVSGGLDSNSPKAVYTACQVASKSFKKPAQKKSSGTQTSEAPTPPPSGMRTQTGSSRKVTVDENDVRVRFYKMKGDKTKEQVQRFMEKLSADDARKDQRRRARG